MIFRALEKILSSFRNVRETQYNFNITPSFLNKLKISLREYNQI